MNDCYCNCACHDHGVVVLSPASCDDIKAEPEVPRTANTRQKETEPQPPGQRNPVSLNP